MLTAARLREVLHYDPKTGVFTWKVRLAHRVQVGQVAGRVSNGYRSIGIDGALHYAHRLAVLYMTGTFPVAGVDHRDGIGTNNRWSNLRQATQQINCQNLRAAKRHNKTGYLGVSPQGKRFVSRIRVDGEVRRLGSFPTAIEAHQAYLDAKRAGHAGNTL